LLNYFSENYDDCIWKYIFRQNEFMHSANPSSYVLIPTFVRMFLVKCKIMLQNSFDAMNAKTKAACDGFHVRNNLNQCGIIYTNQKMIFIAFICVGISG